LDNNVFALKGQFEKISEQILKEKLAVDFNQGLDIRLLTKSHCKYLKKMKPIKQWRFAFDNLKYEKAFRRGIKCLREANVSKSKIMVYVLAGFDEDFESTYKRVKIIYEEYKLDPFIMLYGEPEPIYKTLRTIMTTPSWKKFKMWKDFARWVNNKALFKSIPWKMYNKNRGTKAERFRKGKIIGNSP